MSPKHNIVLSSSLSALTGQLQNHKGLWLATQQHVWDLLPVGTREPSFEVTAAAEWLKKSKQSIP